MTKPVVVVAGALANKARSGGEAWVRLSWTLGLRRLGFDVRFVEQIDRAVLVDEGNHPASFDQSVNLAFFRRTVAAHGLRSQATLLCDDGGVEGPSRAEIRDALSESALLVNISGHLRDGALLCAARRRAFVDIDPCYTQVWHMQGLDDDRLLDHECLFTIAENIGRPGCRIPTLGLQWRTVRQPVVLDDWPVVPAREPDRFTTVGTWRSAYGGLEHDGVRYGQKVHEFRRFLELPARVRARFELALDIDPAETPDLEALDRHGWHLADPRWVAGDPDAFRRYVQGSGAEFSAAQGVYVDTQSGWFSDRSVRYLASGRPVVVQDTGLDRHLPVGNGLHAFRELSEAAAAVERVVNDYDGNSRHARAIAEEYFDSDIVLSRFLDDALAA